MRYPSWLVLYLLALRAEAQGLDDLADRLTERAVVSALKNGWLDRYLPGEVAEAVQ